MNRFLLIVLVAFASCSGRTQDKEKSNTPPKVTEKILSLTDLQRLCKLDSINFYKEIAGYGFVTDSNQWVCVDSTVYPHYDRNSQNSLNDLLFKQETTLVRPMPGFLYYNFPIEHLSYFKTAILQIPTIEFEGQKIQFINKNNAFVVDENYKSHNAFTDKKTWSYNLSYYENRVRLEIIYH